MMVASEADDAWWPPTFSPSTLSRRWLALWMVQLASHSTLRSSSPRMASSSREIVDRALVMPSCSLRLDTGFLEDPLPLVDLGFGLSDVPGCVFLRPRRVF